MRLYSIFKSNLNTKLLFLLRDGNIVESVFYRGDTLCISTQVGCAVNCVFCASGREGLERNLSSKEIIGQYEIASEKFDIKNIAIAGIGEPLHNWNNVLKAFEFFRKRGMKVSFYTVGSPLNRLSELLDLNHNGVTISLHFVNTEKRSKFMKVKEDISTLIEFLKTKLQNISKRKRKKISLGYLLMKGINDSKEDINRLIDIAKYLDLSVTLLYYNSVNSEIYSVSEKEYENIFLYLRKNGIRVTLSNRFRKDPIGGCGTLRPTKVYSLAS